MMDPNKGNSSLNTLVGIIDNAMSRISTAMPVEVLNVDTDSKTLEVMPMVSMLDNAGKAVPHAPISNVPYVRLQGGEYGLIIDPKVGDRGLVVFASRDISKVVETKKKSIPGSLRKHSISDGIYVGSMLMDEPKTLLQITKDAISITVPTINDDGNVNSNANSTHIQVTKDQVNVGVGNQESVSNISISETGFGISVTDKKTTTSNALTRDADEGGGETTHITIGNNSLTIESKTMTIKGDVKITGDATIGGISFLNHVHEVVKEGKPTKVPENKS